MGVDGHAGVFDQQVLQGAGFQEDRLVAVAGEAGWRGDEPALFQRAALQVLEATLLLIAHVFVLLFPAVWVGVSCGVEGGAGGVAYSRAGYRRGDHHQVLLLLLLFIVIRVDGGSREDVVTLSGTGFSCTDKLFMLIFYRLVH